MAENNIVNNRLHEKIIRLDKKKLYISTIIIDILMLIFFVLALTLRNDLTLALYWCFINVYIIIDIVNIMHWDFDGLKIKSNKTTLILNSFRDITTFTMVISGLVYLISLFFDMMGMNVRENTYIITLLFILFSISQLFNHISIYNTKKQTQNIAHKVS